MRGLLIACVVFAAPASAAAWCQSANFQPPRSDTCLERCVTEADLPPNARLLYLAWSRPCLSWVLNARGSRDLASDEVRAVYLDSGRIFVHFSQPMDQVATTAASFALFDEADKDVPISKLVWVGDGSARLEIGAPLDRTALYTLLVRSSAQAADGTALDGDGDGRPGETDDDYSVQFTGSQNIIKSRLGQAD